MTPDLWHRLATVFAAGGGAVLVTLAVGLVLVPAFRRLQFVSRESKEGVAQGRTDTVPMGGGFILLAGVTLVVLALTGAGEIRRGYAACFLIAFWGFGLLGFLDDRSKTVAGGYSNRVKLLLQISVTLTFAVCFYWYYRNFVNPWDLEYLILPFVGPVPLGLFLVPFVMVFLFWVSNAVNITDGFNGLAGGTGAVVALAYTVVTFLIGASELARGTETEIGIRMFALSRMSAIVAGSLVAYLYFNYCRGSIYFGDTGSMSLGAALAFLAVFSRTEFLCCVIGGVFFTEAASVFLQRVGVAGTKLLADPLAADAGEPFRPFIIAPLHHHFEHLLLREMEGQAGDPAERRAAVRRRITHWAWGASLLFAGLGVAAEFGHYRRTLWLYDWSCVAGVVLWLGLLADGLLTRILYDCYFLGPDLAEGTRLTLYRGVPWRLGKRLFHVYETTDIPVAGLSYLEHATALFHILMTRVDARVAFGLLHFQVGLASDEAQRGEHFRQALRFWGEVPRPFLLVPRRRPVLNHMATAYAEDGRFAEAVAALEALYRATDSPAVLQRIDAVQHEALTAAEEAYAWWARDRADDPVRRAALAAHQELLDLLRIRYERARRVLDDLQQHDQVPPEQRMAVERQIQLLQEALNVAADRCDRLQPAGEVG